MVMDETFDLRRILSDKPQHIPIDKCVTGKIQAKQNTQVKEDDPLVISIRDMGGLIHPIIVQSFENGQFKIIDGHRRVNACRILKMNKIKAFVISRDLSEFERKVITLNEGMVHRGLDELEDDKS